MSRAALAFDLGGTELRAALINGAGNMLSFRSVATRAADGPDAVIGQMTQLSDEIASENADVSIIGVGIGAPGPLDAIAGVVVSPPTLAGWHNVPLADILGRHFGLPVMLENDANAAALGEWHYGAGQGATSLVFVTVSTGIGGGVIADGRILHGRRSLAGEIGHMTITSESEPCFCGSIGCFEAVASGTALGRRADKITRPFDGSALRALSGDGEVTGRHVVEAARAGDRQALELIAEEGRWLGIGFTNLLHLYSPDVIVMGGGIAHGFDLLRGHIEATVGSRAMTTYRSVPIVPAKLGRHAGIIGAASLILHEDQMVAADGTPHRDQTNAGLPAGIKESNNG